MIVDEIPVAPGVLGVEISEEPTFPRFDVEITDDFPRGLSSLGVVGVGGPIPAGSKIKVTLSLGGISLREVSSDSGGSDESDIEPVGEHSDRRECADARAAVCKTGPGVAIKQERESGGVRFEFAMERNRTFRERTKVGVDRTTPRPDAGDGVSEIRVSLSVVSGECTGEFVSIGKRECRDRTSVCDGFRDLIGPAGVRRLPRWQDFSEKLGARTPRIGGGVIANDPLGT
ncbi:hypothetical protein [Halorubrum sp. Atlit-26R]|uniref:hypothetical protein n=1 Tax=Halorubrum sp. Atlit-26R TaxID=2282128 RepID=UPI001F2B7B50|nr:hypothetical protein [Halorubrum sp. Atlit-26R]